MNLRVFASWTPRDRIYSSWTRTAMNSFEWTFHLCKPQSSPSSGRLRRFKAFTDRPLTFQWFWYRMEGFSNEGLDVSSCRSLWTYMKEWSSLQTLLKRFNHIWVVDGNWISLTIKSFSLMGDQVFQWRSHQEHQKARWPSISCCCYAMRKTLRASGKSLESKLMLSSRMDQLTMRQSTSV